MEFVWAVAYFAAAVVLHALLSRLPRGNPITKFLLVGGAAGIALIWHLFATGASLAALAAVLTYAFACELYLFLFTLVASSISVRMLLLLRDKSLSASEIQALYDTTGMVQRRLERLVAAGLLQQHFDHYQISDRGKRVVRIFTTLKRSFHAA
jgi:hypothetical protein